MGRGAYEWERACGKSFRETEKRDIVVLLTAADDIEEAAVCPLTTADGKVYALKKELKSGRLLITRTVWGLGGFAVYHAAWKVTSPEIERKLRALFRP